MSRFGSISIVPLRLFPFRQSRLCKKRGANPTRSVRVLQRTHAKRIEPRHCWRDVDPVAYRKLQFLDSEIARKFSRSFMLLSFFIFKKFCARP